MPRQLRGLRRSNSRTHIISLAKDPTICSCEYRTCEYRLRLSSLWGYVLCEGSAKVVVVGAHANPATGAFGVAPLWGHEASEGCAEMGAGKACGRSHWGLRWSFLWGHETCEGCAKMGWRRHARSATGAFGGAPYGATKRVRGVPEWGWNRMRAQPLEPSVELPMGPRNV